MNVTEVNEEVLFTRSPITKVSEQDIEYLKAKAAGNRRKKVRLCAHETPEDTLHEMLIVQAKGAYVEPHKHSSGAELSLNLEGGLQVSKSGESLHVIDGRLKVVVFYDAGDILEVTNMGDYSSGDTFFYRISDVYFHTVIPMSDVVVFHETTRGPFQPEKTVLAPWAPAGSDSELQARYLTRLAEQLTQFEGER